jgi:hypothetical protein
MSSETSESSDTSRVSAQKRYYLANKEHILAKAREYKKNNRERILKHKSEYREIHRKELREKARNDYHERKFLKIENIPGFWGDYITIKTPDF